MVLSKQAVEPKMSFLILPAASALTGLLTLVLMATQTLSCTNALFVFRLGT